jgi:hypothetical protein
MPCIFVAGAPEATVSPKADQEEDAREACLKEPAAPTSLEMGCCGCADESSSKVVSVSLSLCRGESGREKGIRIADGSRARWIPQLIRSINHNGGTGCVLVPPD